jgi:uncharacterized membrane protein YkvI
MAQKDISPFKVAGTYIGTIVGAGFASGQEVFQFFTVFGDRGLMGLVVTTLLFILYGYIIMDMGMQLKSTSHLSIIRHTGGKWISFLADILITFFLFGAFTAMIAGSGALFRQEFNISFLAGNAIMAVITIITVLSGFKGIINAISFVVPFLIVAAVGVSIYSTAVLPPAAENATVVLKPVGFLRNWLWSAILYTSYNTVTSIAILGPLGAEVNNRKTILKGAIMGGLGLGVGAAAIYMALKVHYGAIEGLEVPMISIAEMISPPVKMIYAIVLLAEIYTTAVGNLYGFTARIADTDKKKARYVILISSALAFTASQFGFSNLVKYLYPAVGYGGIIILISLLFKRLTSAEYVKDLGRVPKKRY